MEKTTTTFSNSLLVASREHDLKENLTADILPSRTVINSILNFSKALEVVPMNASALGSLNEVLLN